MEGNNFVSSDSTEKLRPYNSSFECGLRSLFILSATHINGMNLQRIVYYDYATTHLNDVFPKEDKSLHPSTPFRFSEWITRKDILRLGLSDMIKKGLVDVKLASQGFLFQANSLTRYFIGQFQSDYSHQLNFHAQKVAKIFDSLSDIEIESLLTENIRGHGGDFMKKINSRLNK